MPMKAGMADSGRATADTSVARQLRRKNQTTMTARMAPSYSIVMDASNSSCTGVTKSKACVNSRSGFLAFKSASAFCTAAPTSTSLAPLLRVISKPTTDLPFSVAKLRCSATVSFTLAISSRRTRLPLLRVSSSRDNSSTVATVAKVRMGCSEPPRSARPPALSVCTCLSWREISAAVAPRLCSLSGSSATCTSRVAPPTRATEPTPRTPSRARDIVLSTNQLRASSSMLPERMVKARIGAPDRFILLTIGSRKSPGRSLRTCCTALRTSSSASCVDFSRRNSAVTVTLPSCTLV